MFQAASGNSNRRSPTALDTLDPCCGLPATPADYNLNGESTELTDLEQVVDRGYSLRIEGCWCQVADFVLGRLTRRGISATAAPAASKLR